MNFNRHYNLEGKHAFLGASKYHWINYDEEQLAQAFLNFMAAQRGTELHDLAHRLIKLGVKLPTSKRTLNMFVNDAIGYQMESEQPLYFSENCFGTADAICFKKNILRIHDLKTGAVAKPSMNQLYIYAALFCLEYGVDPSSIKMELRIYFNDEVIVDIPHPEDISAIMDKIIAFDKKLTMLREGRGA